MPDTTIAERVAKGAAFLDQHDPGWDKRIDLEALDIFSECRCILGQRRGGYTDGLKWMRGNAPGADQRSLGFMFGKEGIPDEAEAEADAEAEEDEANALTAEWKRLIGQRRAAS